MQSGPIAQISVASLARCSLSWLVFDSWPNVILRDGSQPLPAAQKLILAQGEVIYANNLLHDRFFRLFNIALSLQRPDEFGAHIRFYNHASAIWHVSQSDNQQRIMAFAAISTVPTKLNLKPVIKRLEWARAKADKLAEYRNIIAHNTIMFRGVDVKGNRIIFVPQFGSDITRPIHRAKLTHINRRFWATLRTDFLSSQ